MVQHPITLAWDWFPGDTAAHTELDGHNIYWRGLVEDGIEDLRFVWVSKAAAERFMTTPGEVGRENVIEYIAKRIIEPGADPFSGYDCEREVSTLTKQHVKLFNVLVGVLELDHIKDIRAMSEMAEIHGQELFEWIEEYMIDHKDIGYHKVSMESFVNGIRYLIFYNLYGREFGKTRVTSDMYWRLTTVKLSKNPNYWGMMTDKGDASKKEAEIFGEMVKHGVTEERIEKLRAIDYIVEE